MVAAVDERPEDLELVRLILARQRRQGASFQEALEREGVLAALAATREDLRRAYLRLSPPEPPKSARVVAQRPARDTRRRRIIFTE
jgi:hypothetical protein